MVGILSRFLLGFGAFFWGCELLVLGSVNPTNHQLEKKKLFHPMTQTGNASNRLPNTTFEGSFQEKSSNKKAKKKHLVESGNGVLLESSQNFFAFCSYKNPPAATFPRLLFVDTAAWPQSDFSRKHPKHPSQWLEVATTFDKLPRSHTTLMGPNQKSGKRKLTN